MPRLVIYLLIYLMIGLGVATGRDIHSGDREKSGAIIATRIAIWPVLVSAAVYVILLDGADRRT